MIILREMAPGEIERIGEIDRSERITQQYRYSDGGLELVDVDIHASRWGEPGERAVRYYVDTWRPLVEASGVLLGAFEDEDLVGFAIYRPAPSEGHAQLAALHVSRPARRKGIARLLTDEVVRRARADGARRLYVSATPTRTTVDFYMSQGFEPLEKPDPELFALEPEDIHMERVL